MTTDPAPEPTTAKHELHTLGRIVTALDQLDRPSQVRAARYIADRYGWPRDDQGEASP